MFDDIVFHVSILKRSKDGCRGHAPPLAVLDDDEVDCHVLAYQVSSAGRRPQLVKRKGLPRVASEVC